MRTTEQKADVLWRRRNLSSSGTGVDLTTATGVLAITKGGTGATSAPAALTSLGAYPSTNPSGFTSNLGTVTSVAASVPTFLSIAGSPITTTGTLAITYSGTALPVANGGTGITSFGTGVATWLGTPSSANLAAAITDETGSGALVFGTSPTLSSPTITGTGTAAFGNLSYTGTLTGGTGVIAIGTNQFYKDASGNVGIGTASPGAKLESVQGTSGASGWFMAGQFSAADYPMIRFAATTPNKYSSIGNNADGSLYFFVNGSSGAIGTAAAVLDASGNLTISNGNIIQGTTAKGVNFTANTPATGMTSQLLNWYEEGTWTPTQGSGLVVVGTFSSSGKYTRTGNVVFVKGRISGSTSVAVNGGFQMLGGLPFTSQADCVGVAGNAGYSVTFGVRTAGTVLEAITGVGATAHIAFSITYQV